MPDDPTNPPKGDPPKPDPPKPPATGDLGDAGKKALADERTARKAAEKEASDLKTRLAALEDKDKTETERAAARAESAEKRAEAAEAKALRLEVASSKGLTAAQARRLVGDTKEALEDDADELLATFAPKTPDPEGDPPKPKPGGDPPKERPKEKLRGGADPEVEPEETDPAKLAAMIPRRY